MKGKLNKKDLRAKGFISDVIKSGKKVYDTVKKFKPATKALSVINSHPIISSAFDAIPYSSNVKAGLKIGKSLGFGKG